MILLKIKDSERIESLHPMLKKFFDYVKTLNFEQLEGGRIELEGKNLFINVDTPELVLKENQKLEVHQKYLDVHIPISGTETIGWKALDDIKSSPAIPYDAEKDFAMYKEGASTYFEVHPGEFFIAFPEDAHAPIIGEGKFKKIVGKIKL